MIGGIFEVVAKPMEWVYGLTHSYIPMLSFMALLVIVITAPLVLKSTKGMLEMQKLAPEMRKLQQEYRNDRVKMQEETMKLYSQHKVNPLASCLPLLLQFPVFIIMFQILSGLTRRVTCTATGTDTLAAVCNGVADGRQFFDPKYVNHSSELYQSLVGKNEMLAWGLDLSLRPINVIKDSFGKGLVYAGLVVLMAVLYLIQQKMVASRSQSTPTMSATQAKIMQYLPVAFAFFMIFYVTGLVIFYMAQAVLRIGLNYYITHKFYKGDESLGRQAMRASEAARELAKKDGGGGMFAQAKRDLTAAKQAPAAEAGKPTSKRVTAPKARPTSSGKAARPGASNGTGGRPTRPHNSPSTRHPKKK